MAGGGRPRARKTGDGRLNINKNERSEIAVAGGIALLDGEVKCDDERHRLTANPGAQCGTDAGCLSGGLQRVTRLASASELVHRRVFGTCMTLH